MLSISEGTPNRLPRMKTWPKCYILVLVIPVGRIC
jgi:hypothetical protein